MKKLLFSLLGLVILAAAIGILSSFSRPAAPKAGSKIMQLTSIESLVGGGVARSKLISSDAAGKLEEEDLGHFYSLVGIKFDNINYNDATIAKKLEKLYNEGWSLEATHSTFGARASSNGNSAENGIIITRYILKKAAE